MSGFKYVQIGWLAVPEEDLIPGEDYTFDIEGLDTYDEGDVVHHSHGPVEAPLPVYVKVPK